MLRIVTKTRHIGIQMDNGHTRGAEFDPSAGWGQLLLGGSGRLGEGRIGRSEDCSGRGMTEEVRQAKFWLRHQCL